VANKKGKFPDTGQAEDPEGQDSMEAASSEIDIYADGNAALKALGTDINNYWDGQEKKEAERKASGLKNLKVETANMYTRCMPLIKACVRRYEKLDAVSGREDLVNQAYLAVYEAVRTFNVKRSNAKFTSILTWCLQKQFESQCPSADKQVELIYPDGQTDLIPYKKFQKVKRSLPVGTEWTVTSRYTSRDDNEGGTDYEP